MCGTEQSKTLLIISDEKFAKFCRKVKFDSEELFKSQNKHSIYQKRDKDIFYTTLGKILITKLDVFFLNKNFKVETLQDDLIADGDYTPGLFKAKTVNVHVEFLNNNSNRLESTIECDFRPFSNSKNFMKQTTLVRNGKFFSLKKK